MTEPRRGQVILTCLRITPGHEAVLGGLRGGKQGIEDDPTLTPIHDVAHLMDKPAAGPCPGHRGGVPGSVFDVLESEVLRNPTPEKYRIYPKNRPGFIYGTYRAAG